MKRLLSILLITMACEGAEPSVVLELVAQGLFRPVAITHAGDSRLFVTQQDGRVMIVEGATVRPTPFLDIRSLVTFAGERGLLSIAFDPGYQQNGRFFVNYTDRNSDTVIARYNVSATDPNQADLASRTQILLIDQPDSFANHKGGQLQFGPDGNLYVGMGDGGSGGDPGNRAQNLDLLLGKLLRIDVSGPTYTNPPSNPFIGRSGRDEIWAYGLRNPWRFSFDRASADLWIADVGQGDWEEVNFQSATSVGGENYGWRRMEGSHCFNPPANCNDGTLVVPVIEYGHTGGACSVTGGYVYRGARYPGLNGLYIYGDYCNGMIWGARRQPDGTVTARTLTDAGFFISTFGEDLNGELYVADHQAGAIYRLIDTTPVVKRRSVRH